MMTECNKNKNCVRKRPSKTATNVRSMESLLDN